MVEEYGCPTSTVDSRVLWLLAMYHQKGLSQISGTAVRDVLEQDYLLTFSSAAAHLLQCQDCHRQYDAEVLDISQKGKLEQNLDPVSAWLVRTDLERRRSHLRVVEDK